MAGDVYRNLDVRPVINAIGNSTVLGGSRLSSGVLDAIEKANRQYVWMEDLLKSSGEAIAGMLGAEAAFVTSGCSAALVLSSAACMAGTDPEKLERLPDTVGMPNEILIQKGNRNRYDRCITIPGARLVEVGEDSTDGSEARGVARTTSEQLEQAIGPSTVAIHYLASSEGTEGVLPLKEVLAIGRSRGIPVILDAATAVYPLEKMRSYPQLGVDLICYGAKYFGAPNSTGILCGRKDLIDAAFLHCFIAFETGRSRPLGRAMKVDRQEVIAVVTALKEWFAMDHEARLASVQTKVKAVVEGLIGLAGVKSSVIESREDRTATGVRLTFDSKRAAEQVVQELWNGDPRICVTDQDKDIIIHLAGVNTVADGEEAIIVSRLKEIIR